MFSFLRSFYISSSLLLILALFLPKNVSADWPSINYDHSQTRSIPYEVTQKPEILWKSENIGNAQSSLGVDSEGTIYTGSFNLGLVAIDKNGSKKWDYTFLPNGSPVFDDQGNIYFSTSGSNSRVIALNKDGQRIWWFDLRPGGGLGYSPSGPLAISKDKQTLYVGITYPSYTILALNLDGTVKWQGPTSGLATSGSVTIADSGNLYLGSSGNGRLFAFRNDGIQRWTRFVASGASVSVNSPALDANENLYTVVSIAGANDLIVSYDSAGIKRWQYQALNDLRGGLVYKDNVVYVIGTNNTLYAINAGNGSVKWTTVLTNPGVLLTAPIIDKNGLIIAAGGNKVYIVNPDGTIKWEAEVANAISSMIMSEDNRIYVRQNQSGVGYLYALGSNPIPSKTPLIFIPGIGGSELKVTQDTIWSKDDGHGGIYNRAYTAGEKVWVNDNEAIKSGDDDYFDILRLKTDGQISEANIEITGNLFNGTYGPTIEFFTSNGYVLNQDFFVFPYDWRKDISYTKQLLDEKIVQIKQQTGAEKVDIVGHSMGGLVARNYIADPEKAINVKKLITLGTPHLGAVNTLQKLIYGDCITIFEQLKNPVCVGISPVAVKDVFQNMPAAYQLLPAQKYFTFYSGVDKEHPVPFRDDRDIDNNNISGSLNYAQIKNLLTNLNYNTNLFNFAESFHTIDNNLSNTNGVDITIIAGSGIDTLGQIIEGYWINFAGLKIPKTDQIKINGDKTVPLFSASLTDTNQTLAGNAKVYYSNQEHGNLANGNTIQFVNNILNNISEMPSGISTQPFKLKGNQFSVHSPVNIHAYDSIGNHTGPTPDGDFEINIPGSSYDNLGDAKFIFLPENGIYTFKFEATDEGSFDFKIREYENDQLAETTLYNDIPLEENTRAETTVNTTLAEKPILELDKNGDGQKDADIPPTSTLTGEENFDYTAPKSEVKITGTLGENGWYKSDINVEITAEDEASGSSLLKVEYTLDNGQTINTYSNSFTVSQEGILKLKYASEDKAGNKELPKEIELKIDKTSPEAKVYIDQNIQDIVVKGIDANETTVAHLGNTSTKKKDDAIYLIKDIAGNSLKLDVRERDKNNKDRFRIFSLTYNNNPIIELPENYYNVSYKGKKNKLNLDEQYFEVKKDIKIRIKYDSKKNKSTIIAKESGLEKIKEIKDGLILLNLDTNKGSLETSY